jgi:hypothetical protein
MTRWIRQAAPPAASTIAVAWLLAAGWPAQAASKPSATTVPALSFTIVPTPPPGSTKPPGEIDLIVRAGGTYQESVSVVNYAKAAEKFWLYAADAYTIRNGGGFAVTGLGHTPHGVGSWVSPLPRTITVPGRRQLNIRFTVRVPANAVPGVHAGGIVVEAVNPQLIRASSQLEVKRYVQIFTRIYLTVSGRIVPGFEVSGLTVLHPQPPIPVVTHRNGYISYYVTNTGNTIIGPAARLVVTGLFGSAVMTKTFTATSQILPGNVAVYRVPWRDVPALGPVHVYLTVKSAYGLSRAVEFSYAAVPVPFVIAILVLLACVVFALVLVIRRRRYSPAATPASVMTMVNR